MKRAHTSMTLFLGAWFAALIAGYMTSRGSVFAAGGKACPVCKECAMLDTWWDPQVPQKYSGMVTNLTETATQTALLGTDEGNTADVFAFNCYFAPSYPNPEVTLEGVTYANATLECQVFIPVPPGLYQAKDGTGINHSGVTSTQMICSGVG